MSAIGREGDAGDDIGVAGVAIEFFAGRHIPQANLVIETARHGMDAVRRTGHAHDAADRFLKSAHLFTGGHIPETDTLVHAPGEDLLIIASEDRAGDIVLVTFERADLAAFSSRETLEEVTEPS